MCAGIPPDRRLRTPASVTSTALRFDPPRYLDELRQASLREMLKFHGDFVRQLTLLEVAWDERRRRNRAGRIRKKKR